MLAEHTVTSAKRSALSASIARRPNEILLHSVELNAVDDDVGKRHNIPLAWARSILPIARTRLQTLLITLFWCTAIDH